MGKDYTPSNGTITFSPGILQQIINITIIDDDSVVDNRMFTVHLSGAPTRVTLSPSQATVTIIENDGKCMETCELVVLRSIAMASIACLHLSSLFRFHS